LSTGNSAAAWCDAVARGERVGLVTLPARYFGGQLRTVVTVIDLAVKVPSAAGTA